MKICRYVCEWCGHVIQDTEQENNEHIIKDHCFRIHGVTGVIKRGYKIKVKRVISKKRKKTPISL